MKFKRNYKKGFTLVEILVVIAIGAVLTVVLLPGFTSARRYAQLDEDVTRTIIMIREAQEQSLYPDKNTLGVSGLNNVLCSTHFKSNSSTVIAISATFRDTNCSGILTSVGSDFTSQTLKYSTINNIFGIHFSTPFGAILYQAEVGPSIGNSFDAGDTQTTIILSHTVDPTIQRRIIVKKSGIIDLQ